MYDPELTRGVNRDSIIDASVDCLGHAIFFLLFLIHTQLHVIKSYFFRIDLVLALFASTPISV